MISHIRLEPQHNGRLLQKLSTEYCDKSRIVESFPVSFLYIYSFSREIKTPVKIWEEIKKLIYKFRGSPDANCPFGAKIHHLNIKIGSTGGKMGKLQRKWASQKM